MGKKPKAERSKTEKTKDELYEEYRAALAGMDSTHFENESDGEQDEPASDIETEVEAIDEMLEGKDEKFDKLKY